MTLPPDPRAVSDHRDLALEHLAGDEHDLIAERDAYRELLAVALERLHETTQALDRTKGSMRRLLELTRKGAAG